MSKKTREKSCLKVNSQSGRTEEGDWHAPKNQHFSATGRFERPIFLFGFVARKLPQRTCQLLFFPPQKNPSNFGEGGKLHDCIPQNSTKIEMGPQAGGNFLQLVLLCIDGTLDLSVSKKTTFFSSRHVVAEQCPKKNWNTTCELKSNKILVGGFANSFLF